MNVTKKVLVLICIAVFVSALAAVSALGYYLTNSNHVTVTVTSGAVGVTLAANSTSLGDHDSLLLTATIIDTTHGNGLTCNFYDGSTKVGSTVFANGVASVIVTNLSVGTHDFVAGP